MTASNGPVHNTISGGTHHIVLQAGNISDVQFETVVQAASAPVALAQLPAPVTGFTGRDAVLAQITGLLDPAGDGGTVVVSGLAGVGKTELAVQASCAACEAGCFPGGVLFLSLNGYGDAPVQPGQALDALLRALGVTEKHIPLTTEERVGLYRSELARINGPVLIVADNAYSEAQVRPLLPGPGPHRVVVTSRHTLAGLPSPLRLLDVTELDEDAAVALLDRALDDARPGDDRIDADRPGARQIAKTCGGLPLALQITAALLKADPYLTVSDLAEELDDEVRLLEALQYDDGSGTRVPSVAATFELSYRQLDDATARIFRLLSVNPGPDVSTAAAAVLAALPADGIRPVLRQLARAHLVEVGDGAAGRWRMHDLLRLYARQKSDHGAGSDEPELARERLFRYYLAKASAADRHLQALPGQATPGDFSGRAEALKWLDVERPNLLATVSVAARAGPVQVACDLPVTLGQYFHLRRRLDEWLAVLTISRTVANQIAERGKETRALTQLGWALGERRRFDEAITVCDEAVNILEVDYQLGRAWALTNRGHALRGLERFEEAIEAYQDAAEGYRKIGDQRGLGIALTNLGLARARLDQPGPAVAAHREAVAIFQTIGDRHEQGAALTNLGHVLRDQGEQTEAIGVCAEAVQAYQETDDRHGEGTALDELGLTLQQAGRADEAATTHEMALAIFQTLADRYGQGIALSNAAPAYMELRRCKDAVTASQAAVALFREAADSYSEGIALGRLGLALQELGRFDEAITAHKANLKICREAEDQRGQAEVLDNLGNALQGAQRFDEAIAAYQEALATFREAGNHDAEGTTLEHLQEARAAQESLG